MFVLAGKARRAHRVIYCWLHGEPGLPIDHICNHVECVNPAHLRPVPQRENVLKDDSKSHTAVNARKTHCIRGHDDWVYAHKAPGREHWRRCRTCNRIAARDYYRRKRLAKT
jgi:hypothetical protein